MVTEYFEAADSDDKRPYIDLDSLLEEESPSEDSPFDLSADIERTINNAYTNLELPKVPDFSKLTKNYSDEFLIGARQALKGILAGGGISLSKSLGVEQIGKLADGEVLSSISQSGKELREKIREIEEFHGRVTSYLQSTGASDLVEEFYELPVRATKHLVGRRLEADDLERLKEDLKEWQHRKLKEKGRKPVPVTESRLFINGLIEAIPTAGPMASSIKAQLRKDTWAMDSNGIAYSQHKAKNNPRNYIEHNITSPGDITLLPWEQAEQIIDKFGPDTVKLQFLAAAHTMKQAVPWESSFTLKATDIVRELGWDKNHKITLPHKLNEIAKLAFTLDCLLVKAVWVEGKGNGKVDVSTPTGRMWNVLVDPRDELGHSQLNLFTGKIDEPTEVYITIQPGLWTKHYLNRAGCEAKEALYQFGYIAQDILRLDPYHDWLAFKLMAYLYPASRYHASGEYRVRTLLEEALPIPEIEAARQDKRKGYDLKQRWDNFLKVLMDLQNPWQINFDDKTYPEPLRPGSKERQPRGYLDQLLKAKIIIKPPVSIPVLVAAKVEPKQKRLQPLKTNDLTPDQIRKGREAKGWNQRQLAGYLDVSNGLIGMWEKGTRTPNQERESKLKKLLGLDN